jgi:hypothetical protein
MLQSKEAEISKEVRCKRRIKLERRKKGKRENKGEEMRNSKAGKDISEEGKGGIWKMQGRLKEDEEKCKWRTNLGRREKIQVVKEEI